MKKLIATLMTSVLMIQIAPAVAAKPKGDWNAVKALLNHSVAVKTNRGETHYGLMRSADDTAIAVQIAGQDDFTPQEISFQRNEVAKVWRATLRFSERNVAKGTLIGAVTGLGIGLTVAGVQGARGSADPPVGGVLFPIAGAGAGAIAGALWKKRHTRDELIYSV